jgi:hypothetical protein
MKQRHDPKWLRTVLISAVKSFNDGADKLLLLDEVSDDGERYGSVGERAIAHRLATHLERVLQESGYPNETVKAATDCEYNRHRGGVKQLHVKEDLKVRVEQAKRTLRDDPNREGWYVFSVFPDIIVHERRIDDNNMIVIELKRASNSIDDDYDRLKLELFTRQDYEAGYGYRLGASVIAMDEGTPEKRELFVSGWFIDGEKVP